MEREKKKGRRRKQGSRGAVTIFLVLILVPCIIIVCIFGDVSRVELSKAEAQGAGDLALYSLMAHFDDKLDEYYGLVASCQTIDEYYDETQKFFTGMMRAADVPEAASQLFTAYLDSLRGGDITDFLQVEFVEPASVGELGNSSLGGNAALLEDSIVEFMKYRGPVELVKNVIERFSNMHIADTIEGAEKDQEIVEAKQEYAEAEGDILQKAYHCYLAIRNYADVCASTGIPSFEKYQEYADTLKKIAHDFAKVTDLITKYYAATSGIRHVTFPYVDINAYVDQPGYRRDDEEVGERVTIEVPVEVAVAGDDQIDIDLTTGEMSGLEVQMTTEERYCISASRLATLLSDIDNWIREIENSANAIANECSDLGDPTPANSDVNPAMYCMRVQNAATSSRLQTIKSRGEELAKKYARLSAALTLEPNPETNDLPYNWDQQIRDAMTRIENASRAYFSREPSGSYGTIVRRYSTMDKQRGTVDAVLDRRYEFTSEYLGRSTTIGQFIQGVNGEFTRIEQDIRNQLNRINTAISGGNFQYAGKGYHTISMDQLRTDAISYKGKRDSWGRAIDSSGSNTDYAHSERAEYQGEGTRTGQEDNESTKLGLALAKNNGQSVTDLKTRLVNIRDDMQDFLNSLNDFKYGGRKVTAMGGREDVISAGRTVIPTQVNQISLSLAQNAQAAAGYHSSLLTPSADQVYTAPVRQPGPTGNDPNLDVDPPELYTGMKDQFGQQTPQAIDQKVEENKQKQEENKQKAEDEKNSANGINNDYLRGKGGNLGSGGHSGNAVGLGNVLTGIVDAVSKLLNGNGDELRDELYVAEYIMDMFSYSSFNNEGQHRLVHDNGNGPVYTLKDFKDKGNSYGKDTEWNTESVTEIPENQSLTNQPINAAHNQMNLGEVEYILYGNTNIDENLKKMYGNIYAIRLALNTVSGFQNFYGPGNSTGDCINAFADALMAATAGVVPAVLTKCIIIGVLAVMESAHDVNRLKAGAMVALYKGADNWYFGINSETDSFPGPGTEPKDEGGLYYSDYLYFFLMAGVMSGGGTYKAIIQRTGDLIQANMRKMGSDNFDLTKSQCFFKLSAKLKVKPLFLDLPIASSMEGVDPGVLTNSSGWCTYNVSFTRGYS